ncbi:MAG TPA: TIGR03016 family PEP-CTERM system-associated outer membrane protein [Noviherbaspirillum sp.]|nr:TIGR03016 family PEP-CTERM system-associated outer membrane protein [Noviherbaspirillum sp.]
MRNRNALATLFPLAPIATWVAIAWPTPAGAAEWKLTPGVDLKETYTDNVTLATFGNERSDFVTEITPNLSLNATGARMRFSADYAMRNFFYGRSTKASNRHHHLNVMANAELVEDLFYLDGKASAAQQTISPFGPQTAGEGHLTNNQADVRTYSVSPYLRNRFGRSATAEVRYSRDAVSADTGGLSDSESDRVRISIQSGSDFRTLQWNVLYDDQKIHYDAADDVRTRQLSGSLRYALTSRFSLTATGGYEDNNYASIASKPEGDFWSLGAAWVPSERSSIAVSAGRRFFGNTLSVSAQHRTRMTVWSVGYQEEITTTRSQFLVPSAQDTAAFLNGLWTSSIPDQAAREETVRRFIREANLPSTVIVPVNGFTNRVFLQKSAHASLAIQGVRNTLMTSVFRVEREPQSSATSDISLTAGSAALLGDATRQEGISTAWHLRLSPRTNLTASAGYSEVRSAATRTRDDNVTYRLGLSRQMQQKIKGGVELRRLEKRSTQATGEFRENAVAAFLQISF